MLQDAIWADTERLESDEEYADTAVTFLKAVIKGWIFSRDNPEEAAEITLASGSGWGPSHELWMMNEINKLIWPAPDGIGIIDETAWNQTVEGALAAVNETGAHLITEEPPSTAYSNEYIQQALDELGGGGRDRPPRRGVHARWRSSCRRAATSRRSTGAVAGRRRSRSRPRSHGVTARIPDASTGSRYRIRTVRGLTRCSSDERSEAGRSRQRKETARHDR